MDRAYATITVKSVDEGKRQIRGVASTPAVDRVGDIVEPLGISFKTPVPLLFQHDHRAPVGRVFFDAPTTAGLQYRAVIANPPEAGALKDRCDEAWQSIREGLLGGVSIGFRTLPGGSERMQSGGTRYTKTEVLELSLVTIPAHQATQIEVLKLLDRAASGAGNAVDNTDTVLQRRLRRKKAQEEIVAELKSKGEPLAKKLQEVVDELRAMNSGFATVDGVAVILESFMEFTQVTDSVRAVHRQRRLEAIEERLDLLEGLK